MTHPLDSTVPLRRTYVALNPKHLRYDIIATVGEALQFLQKLPGLQCAFARSSLCWAHRNGEAGIDAATLAFDEALRTDGLFVKTVPAA